MRDEVRTGPFLQLPFVQTLHSSMGLRADKIAAFIAVIISPTRVPRILSLGLIIFECLYLAMPKCPLHSAIKGGFRPPPSQVPQQ